MPSDEPYVRPKISRHVSKPRRPTEESDATDTGTGPTKSTGGSRRPVRQAADPNSQPLDTEPERTTGRSDRAERAQPVDRTERVDRTDRGSGRNNREGSRNRTDMPDRTRQPDRADRAYRPGADRTERTRTERSTGDERANRSDRAERSDGDRSSNRSDDSDRNERSDRADRPESGRDREAEGAGTDDDARGDRARPLPAMSSTHLKVMGPMVSRFHGSVEKVFGTSQRAKPSSRPVTFAIFIAILAFAAPYVVAYLPLIVICLVGFVWVRKKLGGIGQVRMPKFAERTQDPGLQIVAFRVRVPRDDDPNSTFKMINCRLIQKASTGPIQLVASDLVTGSGRKTSGGVIEISRLSLGDATTTLHSASPKSDRPIYMLAALIVAAAGTYLYFRWNSIPPVSWEGVLYPLISAVLPIVVIWFIIKKVLLRR